MASLSDPFVKELLSGRYIASLATVNRDLSIHIVAVWYWSDGAKVYVATAARSRRAQNLQSNPQVSLMIDARDPVASRGITILGIGHLLKGESAREWNTKVHRKYPTESALNVQEGGTPLAAWDDIAIEVTPRKVIAWDMRQVDQQVFNGVFQGNPGYRLAAER